MRRDLQTRPGWLEADRGCAQRRFCTDRRWALPNHQSGSSSAVAKESLTGPAPKIA